MAYRAPLAESPWRPGHRTFASEPIWAQRKAVMPVMPVMPLCYIYVSVCALFKPCARRVRRLAHFHQEKKSIFQNRTVKGNKQCIAILSNAFETTGAPLIVDSYEKVLHATELLLILQGSCQGCEHVLSPVQRAPKLKERTLN